MCGIIGFAGNCSFDTNAFGRALDVMGSRGPDDRGVYETSEVLLGHRRLAILDLSPSGHQPMTTRDGRYTIVFNGEVYNYRELRKPLEDEGIAFQSTSDTEVVLALYAREGPDCLAKFRGMFALAIWDRLEKSLFLARDRMGIKPLYVWLPPDGVGFASEVKALKALPGGPSTVDPRAVAAYLAWGSVPEPKTILVGVEALPAGVWGIWKGGAFKTKRYWRFPISAPTIHQRGEAIEMLRPILREAVALRCISDAPLGAFLSGGIDSSSVVSLMRAAGQSDLRTFSISFPQTPLDEGPYALKVAEAFGTLHTDVSVTDQMVRSELDGFFDAVDQPTCDGVNTYLVSKFARQGGLTVSLSGLGGDELFAGYGTFERIRKASPLLSLMPRLTTWAGGRAASLCGGRLAKLEALSLAGANTTNHEAWEPSRANLRLYYASRGLFMPSQIRKLLHPDLAVAIGNDWSPLAPYGSGSFSDQNSYATHDPGPENHSSHWSSVHTTVALELGSYMRNQLLRDSDVFGMANSLEIRVPLIDHKLVEAIFQVDGRILVHGSPKALLLDALPTPLPRLCTHRPKMGFTFPFDTWLKGAWRDRFEERLLATGADVKGLFSPRAVEQLWRAYLAGKVYWSHPWSLHALSNSLVASG
jgi:asparagine synthase (glutamine-hydrolysing)